MKWLKEENPKLLLVSMKLKKRIPMIRYKLNHKVMMSCEKTGKN
jgi:hypothetical protein